MATDISICIFISGDMVLRISSMILFVFIVGVILMRKNNHKR